LNVVVSLSTMVLSAGFTFYLGIENWVNYGLFSFFSTLAVYNGQRVFKSEQLNETLWLQWVKDNRKALTFVVVTSSVAAIVCLISLLNLNWKTMSLLGVSGLISVLYVVKIRGKNLREIPFLKIHLIALSWTLILIVFPMINESLFNSKWFYGLAHYLFIFGVTIPFDIRDLKYDSIHQKTIPQLVGTSGAKMIGILAVFIFAVLLIEINLSFAFNPIFIGAVAIQVLLLALSNENQSDIYCAGLIDGAIALLGLSYFF
jgi:hypothetical protein